MPDLVRLIGEGERKMKYFFIIVALISSLTACSWQNDQQQAKQVISKFYESDSHIRPKGALTLQELLEFREYLSVPLFELLKDVSEIEEANFRRSDNYVEPLIDGDPFTADPQGQNSYRIVHCALQEKNTDVQVCRIELTATNSKTGATNHWEDQIMLTKDVRGWIIDNVVYGGDNPTMRNGSLHSMLVDILSNSDTPSDYTDGN